MRLIFLALSIFVLFTTSLAVEAAEYVVKDIGILPGATDCSASGVNDKAEVVGWCTNAEGTRRPFYWSEKTGIIELKMPDGCDHAYACAVNNDGLVSGFAISPGEGSRACFWRADKGLIATGPKYSDTKAINEMGQSAGSVGNKASVFSKDFKARSVADGLAYGMNNLCEVTGAWFDQQRKCYEAFFWSEKTGMVKLGSGVAKDVNDSGKIVGYANGKAIVWDRQGNSTALPTLPGHDFASADSVNNSGQVAGSLYGLAVVWQPDNKIIELPNLEKDALSYARSVSESGIVAGEVKDASGRLHAVLWLLVNSDAK